MAQTTEEINQEKRNWHWRNTMRPVRFFTLDARAAAPYLVLLVYIRPISVFLTVVITILFAYLERRGLTFPSAIRAFRSWLCGQYRPGWLSMRRRKMVDFG